MEILFICAGATIIGTTLMARWNLSQGMRFAQIADTTELKSRVVIRPRRS